MNPNDTKDVYESFSKQMQTEDVETIPTGLASLDEALGGGIPQVGLTLIAGETGVFKSALAIQIATYTANQCGNPRDAEAEIAADYTSRSNPQWKEVWRENDEWEYDTLRWSAKLVYDIGCISIGEDEPLKEFEARVLEAYPDNAETIEVRNEWRRLHGYDWARMRLSGLYRHPSALYMCNDIAPSVVQRRAVSLSTCWDPDAVAVAWQTDGVLSEAAFNSFAAVSKRNLFIRSFDAFDGYGYASDVDAVRAQLRGASNAQSGWVDLRHKAPEYEERKLEGETYRTSGLMAKSSYLGKDPQPHGNNGKPRLTVIDNMERMTAAVTTSRGGEQAKRVAFVGTDQDARQQAVADLDEACMEQRTAVLAVSDVVKTHGDKVTLSDVRGIVSGHAKAVLLLNLVAPDVLEVTVGKTKAAATGTKVRLGVDAAHNRLFDLEE